MLVESEFEENTEVWSNGEEDEILRDLDLNETAPTDDSVVTPDTVESYALGRWVILFLMFIQATHKLSNTVVSVL